MTKQKDFDAKYRAIFENPETPNPTVKDKGSELTVPKNRYDQ
jgi:hypothetical protein